MWIGTLGTVLAVGCASPSTNDAKQSAMQPFQTPGMQTGSGGTMQTPINPSGAISKGTGGNGFTGGASGTGVTNPLGKPPTGGAGMGVAGMGVGAAGMGTGIAGMGTGVAGMGMGGTGLGGSGAGGTGSSGTGAGGSSFTGGGGPTLKGDCCPDHNCLCHGDVPAQLTSGPGPFKTDTIQMQTGTAYYPTDADPPFAAIAICPGFLNTGPEMTPWGPFYASWGIVTVVTYTGAADLPDQRGQELLGALDELKGMNSGSSPLAGKLAGRYGTSGYSMGGGGTTIAAASTPTLNSSIGLAAWGGDGTGDMVPELLFCGDADTVAPCVMSDPVYSQIPDATPKMEIVVPGATHFNWFDPTDAGGGMSGMYGLAFEKVFLEGDTRWKPLLLTKPALGGTQTTNIQ
jgi:hypothetical protein